LNSLEIRPLEDKKLTVYLVEKEYNEPFWLIEPPQNGTPSKALTTLFKPSIVFCKFLEKLAAQVHADLATEESGMRSRKEFYESNVLAELFQRKKIPFFPVDIDENARGYIVAAMEEKLHRRDQILEALAKLPKKNGNSIDKEYLIAYGQCLQLELEEGRREAGFPVRENWIAMCILDQAREISGVDAVTCIHVSSPEHANAVKKLLEAAGASVENLKISKNIVSTVEHSSTSGELTDFLRTMQISAKPVLRTSIEGDAPHILFYLDTDKRASSFDICMAYDAGFKAVLPYENISVEDARKVVQDAMFSRGPKGIKYTSFFIGGRDAEKAEELLETVKNTMFPPFETSVIIDPCGAYTTAAAAVAKVEEAVLSHKLGDLASKSCAVFGTGPVGKTIAVLLSRLGCNVMIVSPNPKRTDGEEYVKGISQELRSRYGANVEGVFAPTPAEKARILQAADVVFCASTEGVRVIEKGLLENLKLLKVFADINAVPPLGVEGIKLEDNMREMASGIFGIGALTIGKLKYHVEKEILKEARRSGNVYNYNFALQLARRLLKKELSTAQLSVSLRYPDKHSKNP
jgi:methylene-tetrahydromethanopterin dehydrogenase